MMVGGARRFAETILRLLRDGARLKPWSAPIAIVLGFLSASLTGYAILAIGSGIRHLEHLAKPDAGAAVDGMGLALRGGGLALGLAALLLLADVLAYLATRTERAAARAITMRLTCRIADALARVVPGRTVGEISLRELIRETMRAPRVAGTSLQILLAWISSLVSMVVFVAIMFRASPGGTALVLPTILLAAPPLLLLQGRIKRSSERFFDESGVGASRRVRERLTALDGGGAELGTLAGDDAVRRFMDDVDEMWLAGARSRLAGGAIQAFVLVAVLGGVAVSIARGLVDWTAMLAFVLATVRLLSLGKGTAERLATLARLYPLVRRIYSHVDSLESAGEPIGGAAVRLATADGTPAGRSTLILLVTPESVGRLGAGAILKRLAALRPGEVSPGEVAILPRNGDASALGERRDGITCMLASVAHATAFTDELRAAPGPIVLFCSEGRPFQASKFDLVLTLDEASAAPVESVLSEDEELDTLTE